MLDVLSAFTETLITTPAIKTAHWPTIDSQTRFPTSVSTNAPNIMTLTTPLLINTLVSAYPLALPINLPSKTTTPENVNPGALYSMNMPIRCQAIAFPCARQAITQTQLH